MTGNVTCYGCHGLQAERDELQREVERLLDSGVGLRQTIANLEDEIRRQEVELRKAKRLLVDMLATRRLVRDDVFEEAIDDIDAALRKEAADVRPMYQIELDKLTQFAEARDDAQRRLLVESQAVVFWKQRAHQLEVDRDHMRDKLRVCEEMNTTLEEMAGSANIMSVRISTLEEALHRIVAEWSNAAQVGGLACAATMARIGRETLAPGWDAKLDAALGESKDDWHLEPDEVKP